MVEVIFDMCIGRPIGQHRQRTFKPVMVNAPLPIKPRKSGLSLKLTGEGSSDGGSTISSQEYFEEKNSLPQLINLNQQSNN